MQQIIPITTLLLGAALLLGGGRLARHQRISETTVLSLALGVVALGLALAPSEWRAWLLGGETGDRLLTFAREVGVIGLVFLAGTRFKVPEVWPARRISFFVAGAGALLLVTVAILLTILGEQNRGAVIATAAAIVGMSLWLSGQLSLASKKGTMAAASARGAEEHNLVEEHHLVAAVLTVLSILVVHFYAVFDELSGRRLSGSAYTIVALYELVKIAVFFSLAYFVTTRFLARAEGRVSNVRTLVGYLLIVVLVFTLAVSTIGPLGGVAWSFVAGALLVRSELGRKLIEKGQSVTVAMLLSFAFLPLLLQAHGRSLTNKTLVISAVIAALICKFAAVWVGAKTGGASGREAHRVAAATLASGEMAIVFLGFGMTKWDIGGPFYFGILTFTFFSMLLGPALWGFAEGEARQPNAPRQRKSGFRQQAIMPVAAIVGSLLMFGSIARAQSQSTVSGNDPVARAMERVQKVVDERAAAAGRVLAAERLVNESEEAKKQGKNDQAKEALAKAEQIVAGASQHNFWADELMRRVTAERAASSPAPVASTFQPLPMTPFGKAIPRLVLARYSEYRDTLGRILVEEKVPAELLAVALIESGFNPLALSPKGARGIWQFMPATAARYGLAVQPANDHRTHPEHSTRAAARYLRDLYQQFGDWKLALAAYNAGEARVQQIIDRTGIHDFDEMARRGLLPLETRNYVPAVLAAWAQMSKVNDGNK